VVRVTAPGASVSARQAIMAVDALSWNRAFDPWEHRTITMALQTAAVTGLAEEMGLHEPFYTTEMPLLWGRSLPDGSLLFGRELLDWPPPDDAEALRTQLKAAGDRLIRRVQGLHQCLTDVPIRRVWAGPTARTQPGVPVLVDDPSVGGVIWAGGYGGHGLAQAFTLGRTAADAAAQRLMGTSATRA
jgi:glycine/D-amino acid oxidase-like deaminating enzyme